MSTLDTISGIAVGAFLLTVAVKGNSAALIAQAKKDASFLKWGVAAAILAYLYNEPGMQGPIAMIAAMAFLGLFLNSGGAIEKGLSTFWSSL